MPIELVRKLTDDRRSFAPVGPSPSSGVSRRSILALLGATAGGILAWDASSAVRSFVPPKFGASSAPAYNTALVSKPLASTTPWTLSVAHGTTSVALTAAQLALFPVHTVRASGHTWSGPSVADLVQAVGAAPTDRVRLMSSATAGPTLGARALAGATVILALKRDSRAVSPTVKSAHPSTVHLSAAGFPLHGVQVIA